MDDQTYSDADTKQKNTKKTFSFDYTFEDVVSIQKLLWRKNKWKRFKWSISFFIFLSLTIYCLAYIKFFRSYIAKDEILSLFSFELLNSFFREKGHFLLRLNLVLIAGLFILQKLFYLKLIFTLRQIYSVPEQVSLTLRDKNFHFTYIGFEPLTVSWDKIWSLELYEGKAIVILVSRMSGIILPRRIFPSETDYKQVIFFLERIKDLHLPIRKHNS